MEALQNKILVWNTDTSVARRRVANHRFVQDLGRLIRSDIAWDFPWSELYPVSAMNSPDGARLRPGMFVRGRFLLGETSTLVVPQSAIAMRDGFSYVFRIESDQRVTQLRIQTGRITAERVEIVSGLKGDETLVATGAGFLNDGDQVRVVPAPAGRR